LIKNRVFNTTETCINKAFTHLEQLLVLPDANFHDANANFHDANANFHDANVLPDANFHDANFHDANYTIKIGLE